MTNTTIINDINHTTRNRTMATTSLSSPPDSSPPLLPPISSSDDFESSADSSSIPSSPVEPPTHRPLAYPVDIEESSDNDADVEPDAGSPTLPPGLDGYRASVGGTEQVPEEIETPIRTLVPIPTVSPAADSISFAFPDSSAAVTSDLSVLSRPLPQEAGADIVIAPDSSYVETSSGLWAMELKRRYDALYGVNVTVRSPYATTAFVGQHGQKRYRIGHRELSAPGASGAAAEDILVQSKSPPPQTSPQSSKTRIVSGGGRSKSNSTRSPPASIAKPTSKASLTSTETYSHRPSHQSQSYSRASKSSKNGKRHSRGRISINALLGSGSGSPSGSSGSMVASRMHSLSVTATDMPHIQRTFDLYLPPAFPMTKAPERNGDSFGEVMGWSNAFLVSSSSTPGSSNGFSTSAPSTSYAAHNTRNVFFEPEIETENTNGIDSSRAIRRSTRANSHLREMQSFESGLTATPIPPITPTSPESFSRPSSNVPRASSSTTTSQHTSQPSTPQTPQTPRVQMYSPSGLPPRLAKFTTYSTEIFDVLQTSRGLPRLDLLDVQTVPVKLSLSQDGSAAPKDDPRFVIWGEVSPSESSGTGGGDASSVSHESSASTSSSIGIRLGAKGKGRGLDIQSNGAHGGVNAILGSEDGSQKNRVLLAATIERWLAQLTSELDYDELLNFFLTYRTYVSALDLARLLMTRFCWANDVNHDDVVRRIVRVRTFVAFKYWLITFFTVDFVPNRELRLFVANYLNDLAKELRELKRESIVKKLKNVAKDCKKLYTHNNTAFTSSNRDQKIDTSRKSISITGNVGSDDHSTGKENLFGENFAEATRKLSAASAHSALDVDDSDVDLDFIDEPSSSPYSGVYGKTPANNVNLGGASTLNLSTAISPPGPGSIPLSSFSILQRTDHAPGPDMFSNSMYSSPMNTSATSIPHNALSRVLVKTLGRLGRWKRVLNSGGVAHGVNMHRSMTTGGLGKPYGGNGLTRMATACADVSAFDVELTVDSSDLLTSSGGVESYLRLVEGQSPQFPRNHLHAPPTAANPVKLSSKFPAAEPQPVPFATANPSAPDASSVTSTPLNSSSGTPSRYSTTDSLVESSSSALPQFASDGSASDRIFEPSNSHQSRNSVAETVSDYGAVINVHGIRDSFTPTSRISEDHNDVSYDRESRATRRSSRASSADSFGEPLSANRASARFPAFTSPWQFDVVSLDDLSDNSSDEHDNASRRGDAPAAPLGMRRPPRRLPHRREFEFLERPETVSSMGIISRSSIVSASSASEQSTTSHTSSSSAAGGLGAGIHQWQMNALKDSLMDDEEPGDVDEALKRLEGQVNPQKQQEKTSKVNGWVKTIRERLAAGDYSDEEPMYSDDEEEGDQHEGPSELESSSSQVAQSVISPTPGSPEASLLDADSGTARTPVKERVDQIASPARSTDAKPAVEDVVPLEIRQSRLSSEAPPVTSPVTSNFADPSRPKPFHRSFVLLFKAEDLAQHFAMIDRELFMTIKFEELLLEEWMFCEEVDTLDWAQFLKDRARWKVESRWPEKTSALGAVRARFNLMVNFTVSEIALTNPTERSYVFSRFLRIAWKSYQRNSFNTLVAIMTGLQSSWVMRAMRKSMHKLTVWDNRMLTDLKLFTSGKDNFKHIRNTVNAINDAKPPEATLHAPSAVNAAGSSIENTPSACIPFMGAYLSQLYQYNQLPVLIDPTAPHEVVTFDPVSSNLSSPAHPQVFSTLTPLPLSMHLEPLINVHRQRLIAAVIKSLVAGQHLASRVQFPIDKKLFHKCLRIRGLDSDTLQRALAFNAP
ncbi:hypothetical protein GGU10DRAFT_299762 [Lentinula aff. detonsa]|uniref:Ras GEF n=1 Tax=Lentinula aff. detonsa TaxID=2804958 RepID=A0AA38KU04_9AGAR|nr:hypothetical protein GGU10DRAFT_299762 [Lentinula aff. detonsa]